MILLHRRAGVPELRARGSRAAVVVLLDRRRRLATASSSRRTRRAAATTRSRSKNLGEKAGLVVASALLVDYVLTVAVSVASGVDNIISAFPVLNAVPGRDRRRLRHHARRREPARRARVEQGVRPPDLPLHRAASRS